MPPIPNIPDQPTSFPERPRTLADEIEVPRSERGYALPYYTRNGADTEFLISNPNQTAVLGIVAVYGPECRIVERLRLDLGPHCTQSFRIRSIVPDHAGHVILSVSLPVVVHLLYLRGRDFAVVGGELAGADNLFQWLPIEQARTYGFGYRTVPFGRDLLQGSVFVSNPNTTSLMGLIIFYNENCEPVARSRVSIDPGCTVEYPFPRGYYGYGRIQVSGQAVINVLHITASARGVAAAELLGEMNRIDGPPEPPWPKSKVLIDDTHGCRPGAGDWTNYETALTAAGYSVSHYTVATVTLASLQQYDVFVVATPRAFYSSAENQAMVDFVNSGGGLMIVQEYGVPPPTPAMPWSAPGRAVLNVFGASDDNNMVQDNLHNDPTHYNPPFAVVFEAQRNFLPHPITLGLTSFGIDAVCSLSGGSGWATIVETDSDAIPMRRPVMLGRTIGAGRVLAYGDSNTWANHLIGKYENRIFGVRCVEWLLFRI